MNNYHLNNCFRKTHRQNHQYEMVTQVVYATLFPNLQHKIMKYQNSLVIVEFIQRFHCYCRELCNQNEKYRKTVSASRKVLLGWTNTEMKMWLCWDLGTRCIFHSFDPYKISVFTFFLFFVFQTGLRGRYLALFIYIYFESHMKNHMLTREWKTKQV